MADGGVTGKRRAEPGRVSMHKLAIFTGTGNWPSSPVLASLGAPVPRKGSPF